MESSQVPPREEIPLKHRWNDTSLFPNTEAWEKEYEAIVEVLKTFRKVYKNFNTSAADLARTLDAAFTLANRAEKVHLYAGIAHYVDMTDGDAAGRLSQARSLFGQVSAGIAFLEPAILKLEEGTLRSWTETEPDLAKYEHYFDNLLRKAKNIRSEEVEELLGMLRDPFAGVSATAGFLKNADFVFKPGVDANGEEVEITQGSFTKILTDPDRELRRTSWENYLDKHLAFKNTLTTNLETSIKQNLFLMRTRGHTSTLEAALFEHNIPVEVFHNLIGTFQEHLPVWHRYFAIRRKILGVDTLHPYDMRAPLSADKPDVSYEQAVKWICEGLTPMGEQYVEAMRRGCLEERWVDIYPNRGKTQGAFSSGTAGTHPFIVMSFNNTLLSLSTLAHELGHSMHSYLARRSQPLVYSAYSLFVAEVASNFNQAMVREHLLENASDPSFKIAVIEEAMANFFRYFFIMPTLARFELEMHERVEKGEGLTADLLIERMADLFQEGCGEEVYVDRERVGITWATFGHLYTDYYVYQYATGISGAHALAARVLSGEDGAVEDYLNFLSTGSSLYPLDALSLAGVNLREPQPVKETFATMEEMVNLLDELTTD
ncbi:MAG: oligoendopeptidase F [Anaerolineales bacterium]|nr:MAG: oligoendopeptidase F [Anaerolineales bacterium]